MVVGLGGLGSLPAAAPGSSSALRRARQLRAFPNASPGERDEVTTAFARHQAAALAVASAAL
eukprot:5525012-Alexandrium_andersonii.AAC.1